MKGIMAILRKWAYAYRKRQLKKKHHLKFGREVYIDRATIFEGYNYLSNFSALLSSRIGYASYLGEKTSLINANIGRYTSIGPDVKGIYGQHPSKGFISTHPAFFSMRKQVGFTYVDQQLFPEVPDPIEPGSPYTIKIGNDVWIGAGVRIMEGVQIGDGAIVAARALVTKDVPPYAIVGGIPAKTIKMRFDPEQIDFLMRYKWWDKDPEWIKAHAGEFADSDSFFKTFADDV